MLEIEKVGAVPDRVQLGGNGTHDGDDGAVLQLRVDRCQAGKALHATSSHIRSRPRSRATGDSELWASAIALSTPGATCSGRGRSSCAMWSASSTGRGYFPPSGCQRARSPNPPRPDRQSTRLNSSHTLSSYPHLCRKKTAA